MIKRPLKSLELNIASPAALSVLKNRSNAILPFVYLYPVRHNPFSSSFLCRPLGRPNINNFHCSPFRTIEACCHCRFHTLRAIWAFARLFQVPFRVERHLTIPVFLRPRDPVFGKLRRVPLRSPIDIPVGYPCHCAGKISYYGYFAPPPRGSPAVLLCLDIAYVYYPWSCRIQLLGFHGRG